MSPSPTIDPHPGTGETQLRVATPADGAALARIYRPYVTDDAATSFEEDPPDPGEMARRVTQVLAQHPYLVAERDGEVIGYAYASPHRARSSYRWSVDLAVYIEAGRHRRGLGRLLYERLLSLLAAQGYVNAYAGITLPNPASLGLHQALGFVPVAVYQRVGFKRGAWRDVAWWHRPLVVSPPSPPAEPIPFAQLPAGR